MLDYDKQLPADQRIKHTKRLTYDILDGMVDWVRVIDRNGRIIFTNKSMQKVFGEDLLGKKCYDIFSKCSKCIRCIGEATVSTGEPSEKEEHIGNRIYSVKSSPVRDLNEDIYSVVEVFRDVTRERTLEKDILSKNEKMSRDIDFAKKIQRSILPNKGIYETVSVDYLYMPSEILSGDIFDIQKIDEDHLGVYISDVVGHGVSASIMTMFIRQTMESIMRKTISPSNVISDLHKSFLDLGLDDENYFTIFYGIINMKSNTMKYSNGGHNSLPCVISKDLENKKQVKFLEATGYPITYLFDKVNYDEYIVELNKGDELLFFTDGILECKNFNNELFGQARLVDTIESSNEDTIEAIKDAINEFKEDYLDIEDDIAILKLEVLE